MLRRSNGTLANSELQKLMVFIESLIRDAMTGVTAKI